MVCYAQRKDPTTWGLHSLHYIFILYNFFYYLNTPFGIPITYAPNFFIFATPFRNSHSRPHFVTHICDPHSRPTFRDSTSNSHSRFMFATPLATHIHDSRSCHQLRLAIFRCDFHRATPPLTDGLC